jgi:hypothetical protein
MIQADIGIQDWRRGADALVALRIAPDQQPDHVGEVLLGTGQPVLHAQEIGPRVLGRTGDVAQQLGQPAQHAHLLLAAGLRAALAVIATQLLQHRHRAARLGGHVELAELAQAHDLAARHAAHHRRAILAPRLQRRLHRTDMVVEKQHGGDDDVAAFDVAQAVGERVRIAAPFARGVDDDFQPWNVGKQAGFRTGRGAGQMTVHRHDDESHRRRFSAHNGPWHHRASRG